MIQTASEYFSQPIQTVKISQTKNVKTSKNAEVKDDAKFADMLDKQTRAAADKPAGEQEVEANVETDARPANADDKAEQEPNGEHAAEDQLTDDDVRVVYAELPDAEPIVEDVQDAVISALGAEFIVDAPVAVDEAVGEGDDDLPGSVLTTKGFSPLGLSRLAETSVPLDETVLAASDGDSETDGGFSSAVAESLTTDAGGETQDVLTDDADIAAAAEETAEDEPQTAVNTDNARTAEGTLTADKMVVTAEPSSTQIEQNAQNAQNDVKTQTPLKPVNAEKTAKTQSAQGSQKMRTLNDGDVVADNEGEKTQQPQKTSVQENVTAVKTGAATQDAGAETRQTNAGRVPADVADDSDVKEKGFDAGAAKETFADRLSGAEDNRLSQFVESVMNAGQSSNSQTSSTAAAAKPQMNLLNTGTAAFGESLENVIRFTNSAGTTHATLIVDPPAIGKVSVEIVATANGVDASLKVSSEQVRVLVQEQLAQLKQNLADIGVNVTGFSVDVRQNDREQSEQQRPNRRRYGAVVADDETIGEETTFRVDLNDGVLQWVA